MSRQSETIPLLFSAKQVSQILNISRSQVYVLLKKGELRSLKIGKSRRISRDQLLRFLEAAEGEQSDS